MFLAERMQQHTACFVVADYTHGEDRYAQIGKVINGVSSAAWNDCAITMAQNEYRRLPRDPGDLAINKLVGNEIAQDGDAELGKLLNDFDEAVGRFLGFLHGLTIFSCRRRNLLA